MKKATYAGATIVTLAILFLTSPGASAQGTTWFDVEITAPGEAPVLIPDVTDVTVDDIVFDRERVTDITPDLPATLAKDRQQGYVLYRPGNHKPGKMTCSRDYGHTPEFQTWSTWRWAVNDGKTDRRTVTVKLKADDGSVVKSWIFEECEPLQLDVSADGQTETLVCSIGSITLSARESSAPSISEVVVTKATDRNGVVSPPILWDSWSGGEPALLNTWVFRGTQYHEDTLGGLLVEPLTLTGDVMDGRKAMYDWLNDAMNGQPWAQSLSLRESPSLPVRGNSPGRTFTFYDCFPTRYVFPQLNARSSGHAGEKLEIAAERIAVIADVHQR